MRDYYKNNQKTLHKKFATVRTLWYNIVSKNY